jgi:hypothetical protein
VTSPKTRAAFVLQLFFKFIVAWHKHGIKRRAGEELREEDDDVGLRPDLSTSIVSLLGGAKRSLSRAEAQREVRRMSMAAAATVKNMLTQSRRTTAATMTVGTGGTRRTGGRGAKGGAEGDTSMMSTSAMDELHSMTMGFGDELQLRSGGTVRTAGLTGGTGGGGPRKRGTLEGLDGAMDELHSMTAGFGEEMQLRSGALR